LGWKKDALHRVHGVHRDHREERNAGNYFQEITRGDSVLLVSYDAGSMGSARERRRGVIALLAWALCAGMVLAWGRCAYALDPALDVSQYAHTAWKVRESFFKGIITSITQTPDGYLWLGTEFGLLRFDGVRAVPWEPPAGEHLPSSFIRSLFTARDGTLWIGTFKGLASWKDGKLTQYPELGGQTVDALLEDREGTVWAGGFVALTGRLCAIQSGSFQCYGEDGSLGRYVGSLHEDSRGNLWAGTTNGLWRWKPGPPKHYPTPDPVDTFQVLSEGDNGALLIATRSGIKHLADGKVEAYPLPSTGPQFKPNKLFRDRNGGLWIGTRDRGLVHVHQGKTDVFAQSDGLSDDVIHSFFEDREGNIWVATSGGLDRFRDFAVPTISVKQGLSSALDWSVLAARDGSVWLGTVNGLNRWKDGQITIYRKRNGLPDDAAASLFQDNRGRIWVSTAHGVASFENGRFIPSSAVPDEQAFSIAEGSVGDIWINHDRGLFHLHGGKVIEQIRWARLGRKEAALSLLPDLLQGGLWLGFAQGGVAYFRDGQVRASYAAADGLGEGRVSGLQLDRDGTLWAATEGGLSRVKNGRVATLTSKNGLPCDTVLWAMEDDAHSFWLYMACGLVRIARTELDAWAAIVDKGVDKGPKRTIEATVFDSSDGVRSHAIAGGYSPRVAKTADGKLWFLPHDGVSVVDPRHMPFNKLPPPVHIEQVTADRKTYWQNWSSDASSSHPRLPPLVRDLEIDYTALSLVAPEKVFFRYKLEGWERDWQDAGNRRQAFYTNLSPGKYRFRVAACNNSGVWNEAGTFLDFSIAPAYYQANWFRALCAAAFLGMLWVLYQVRIQQVRRQQRKLQDVIETIPTFAWTALRDGSVDFVNRHWPEYTGLSTEKTVGSGWEAAVHPADLKRHAEKWRASVATGEPFENEVRYRRAADGQYRWFLARAVPLRDARGKIRKWYGISTDVEDRKHAEQERERLQADLAHVNRVSMLGELASSLSHELKQPIAATITNANTCMRWLKRDQPDLKEACEATKRIVEDGKRAGDIIERLRSLYKKSPPKRELVEVNEIVREMVVLLRGEANRYAVSMRTDLATDLPKITADRVQLQQVLMNLMLNAIEAMKETGGVLTVKSQRDQDGRLLISVSDTGVGLPAEKADQIFNAFFTTKPQGSGMGLAISRSIVESHGGHLWATANSARGATFYFTLPAAVAAQA